MSEVTINREERDAIRYHVAAELALAADSLTNPTVFDASSRGEASTIAELVPVLDALGWENDASSDSYVLTAEHRSGLLRGRASAAYYVKEDEEDLERDDDPPEEVRAEMKTQVAEERATLASFDGVLSAFSEPVAA